MFSYVFLSKLFPMHNTMAPASLAAMAWSFLRFQQYSCAAMACSLMYFWAMSSLRQYSGSHSYGSNGMVSLHASTMLLRSNGALPRYSPMYSYIVSFLSTTMALALLLEMTNLSPHLPRAGWQEQYLPQTWYIFKILYFKDYVLNNNKRTILSMTLLLCHLIVIWPQGFFLENNSKWF